MKSGNYIVCEHRISEERYSYGFNFVDEEIGIYDLETDSYKLYNSNTIGAPSNPYYVITISTRNVCLSNKNCSSNIMCGKYIPNIIKMMTPDEFKLFKCTKTCFEMCYMSKKCLITHLSHGSLG